MDDISISTRGGRTQFRPGEVIEGSVNWNLSGPPKSVEIRLMWKTLGKGTTDASVVESTSVNSGIAMADASYRFTLPEAPHSFEGQLISLVWNIDVQVKPARGKALNAFLEFDLTPFESPIVLAKVEKPVSELESKWKSRAVDFANKRSGGSSNFRP